MTHWDQIPADFALPNFSEEMKQDIQYMLHHKRLVFAVVDDRIGGLEDKGSEEGVRQKEILTERRMKKWLLTELKGPMANSSYRSAASTKPDFEVDKIERTLRARGILWDTVDVCHEPFVADIDRDWKDATRFMVAIGCCKALALASHGVLEQYDGEDEASKAFWMTLLVAQNGILKGVELDQVEASYKDWLPKVPDAWIPKPPL